jgi:hypothetical protein
MTEAEWQAGTNPDQMLNQLGKAVSKRKLRLLACACCRPDWDSLSEDCRRMLLLAERFADGQARKGEMPIGLKHFWHMDRSTRVVFRIAYRHASLASLRSAVQESRFVGVRDLEDWKTQDPTQAKLLREVFGNPFRPVNFRRTWRTPTATALATAIYDARAFERLPILADALEDAGCDEAALLEHCRSGGEHVRGCWALDLVLGLS